MAKRRTRRRYLLALGAVGTVGLAGCSESEPDGTETYGTATPTDDRSSSVSAAASAEATMRQYLRSAADGDTETFATLVHPESVIGSNVQESEISITEVETVTLSEVAAADSRDPNSSQFEAARAKIEADVERIGAESYEIVYYEFERVGGGTRRSYDLLVRDDGRWYVYKLEVDDWVWDTDDSESADQVTNRLDAVNTVGIVDGGAVGTVELTVKPAPGARDIDLRQTTLRWIDATGTYVLTSESATGGDGTFAVTARTDEDGSVSTNGTLNDPADRATIAVDLSTFRESFAEGATATVQVNTQSGGTTEVRLVVPETLAGSDAVSL